MLEDINSLDAAHLYKQLDLVCPVKSLFLTEVLKLLSKWTRAPHATVAHLSEQL